MKTKLALLSLFVFALFTAGCASASKLNSLHIGMTKPEVLSILGAPDSTSAQGNIEYLTYYLMADGGSRAGYDQPYSVRLVEGKVESFGRFTQLLDVYYRPPMGGQTPSMGFPGYPGSLSQISANCQSSQPSLVSEISRLNVLRQQGVITEEEFQKAKQKLLSAEQK